MSRSPVHQSVATDGDGRITGMRYFYDALDEDQRADIAVVIPYATVTDRGDLVEVFVPNA